MGLICRGRRFDWGERTYIMGVINLAPDSFSGDGLSGEEAVARARRLEEEGADIIDVGGESTRPGAEPVSAEVELRRLEVLPRIVEAVGVPVSIDTYKYEVASWALEAGAHLINDVWGLKRDPRLAWLAGERGVPLVLAHNQWGAKYGDLIPDISSSLKQSLDLARASGVAEENIILDPGIGFGKTLGQNLEVMCHLEGFKALGYPLLVGTSRKLVAEERLKAQIPPSQRWEETAATVALAIAKGADIVRVHDVPSMLRVCRMVDAIIRR